MSVDATPPENPATMCSILTCSNMDFLTGAPLVRGMVGGPMSGTRLTVDAVLEPRTFMVTPLYGKTLNTHTYGTKQCMHNSSYRKCCEKFNYKELPVKSKTL